MYVCPVGQIQSYACLCWNTATTVCLPVFHGCFSAAEQGRLAHLKILTLGLYGKGMLLLIEVRGWLLKGFDKEGVILRFVCLKSYPDNSVGDGLGNKD